MIGYLYGVGAIFCWATLAVSIGESLQLVAPETALFYGLLAAAGVLYPWQVWWQWRKKRNERKAQQHGEGADPPRAWLGLPWPGWGIAGLGIFGIWGYHSLLVLALHLAPRIKANIINYAWPLWIVLLAALLPGHRLTPPLLLAGVLGFVGVIVVSGGERLLEGWGQGQGFFSWLGLGLALAAGLSWASFTVLLRRFAPQGQHMPLFCLLAVPPAALVVWLRGADFAVAPPQLPVLLYFGLVPLGLSFVLWERAVQRCNVQVLGLLSFFTPVLSTLLLSWASGKPVSASAWLGMGLILGGCLLARGALPADPHA